MTRVAEAGRGTCFFFKFKIFFFFFFLVFKSKLFMHAKSQVALWGSPSIPFSGKKPFEALSWFLVLAFISL